MQYVAQGVFRSSSNPLFRVITQFLNDLKTLHNVDFATMRDCVVSQDDSDTVTGDRIWVIAKLQAPTLDPRASLGVTSTHQCVSNLFTVSTPKRLLQFGPGHVSRLFVSHKNAANHAK
jgi:hypothetical protein